jgi:hypothetical protein
MIILPFNGNCEFILFSPQRLDPICNGKHVRHGDLATHGGAYEHGEEDLCAAAALRVLTRGDSRKASRPNHPSL